MTRWTPTGLRTAAAVTLAAASLGVAGCSATPQAPPTPSGTTDGASVRPTSPGSMAREFAAAFNQGDARTLADLFAEHAEFVNIYGSRMSGRAGIERGHRAAFASRLDGSHLAIADVVERRIRDDLVVVQAVWRLTPDGTADPALVVPESTGILTFTALRTPGVGWEFVTGTNVLESTPPS